jgi:hypothetical protein
LLLAHGEQTSIHTNNFVIQLCVSAITMLRSATPITAIVTRSRRAVLARSIPSSLSQPLTLPYAALAPLYRSYGQYADGVITKSVSCNSNWQDYQYKRIALAILAAITSGSAILCSNADMLDEVYPGLCKIQGVIGDRKYIYMVV